MTHDEGVSFGMFGHRVGISAYCGYFGAHYNGVDEVGLRWESSPRGPEDQFHEPIEMAARGEETQSGVALPPHAHFFVFDWLVVLLFALVWGVWLFFHWKREQGKRNA